MANWKAILSLFIIFTIIGLLVFTPRGQKITGNRTMPVGSFLKSITGKVTKSGSSPGPTALDITLTGVNPSDLDDVEFSISGDSFYGKLYYEVVSIPNSDINVKFDDKEIDVGIESLIGDISFLRSGDIKIGGKTSSLKLNNMEIAKPEIEVLIVGQPINYQVEKI